LEVSRSIGVVVVVVVDNKWVREEGRRERGPYYNDGVVMGMAGPTRKKIARSL